MYKKWLALDAFDKVNIIVLFTGTILSPLVLKAWAGVHGSWFPVLLFALFSSILWAIGAVLPILEKEEVRSAALSNGYAALFAVAAASLGLSYPAESAWWLHLGFPVPFGLPK